MTLVFLKKKIKIETSKYWVNLGFAT
jgi:hypothetical protein